MQNKKRGLVYGVGVNDFEGNIYKSEHYSAFVRWQGMIMRCYSDVFQKTRPTYENVTVCDEWKTFSNFLRWHLAQDVEGKHMDKELIGRDNPVYSPDTVVFIPPELNAFFTDRKRFTNGAVGVSLKSDGYYHARVMNVFSKQRESLGKFKTVTEAHEAWRKRKEELANQWADKLQSEGYEERIVTALRKVYSKDYYYTWAGHNK